MIGILDSDFAPGLWILSRACSLGMRPVQSWGPRVQKGPALGLTKFLITLNKGPCISGLP